MKFGRRKSRFILPILVFGILVVLNQNCGGGFHTLQEASTNAGLGASTSTTNPATNSTVTTLPPTTTTMVTTTTVASTTTTTMVSTTTTLPTSTTIPPFSGDVKILFPPASATSEANMVVRGASRPGAGVTEVSVNGVQATSTDGFLTWRATVPLAVGANNLLVDLRKGSATTRGAAAVNVQRFSSDAAITRGTGAWGGGRLNGMEFESAIGRMDMTDDVYDGVWGVDLASGNRTRVSGGTFGVGFSLTFATGIGIYNRSAIVIDTSYLVNVNLVNGDRSLFLELLNPDGSNREIAQLLRISPDGLTYVALARTAILKINALTKAVTEIPLSGGTQPAAGNPSTMAVHWGRNEALVASYSGDQVIGVNLSTGVRRVVVAAGSPRIDDSTRMTIDETTNQAFFWNGNGLLAIDLTSGQRRVIGNAGPLTNLNAIKAIAMTPYGPAVLDHLQDYEGGPRSPTLIVIDPLIGTRVILSR